MKKIIVLVLLVLWFVSIPAFSEIETINAERKTADKVLELRVFLMRTNIRLLAFKDEISAHANKITQADKDSIAAVKPHLTTMYNASANAVGSIDTEWPDLN